MSKTFFGMPLLVDPDLPPDTIRFVHTDGRVEDFSLAPDITSKEPELTTPSPAFLEEGTVFEHDGDLYLVEKLDVRITVTAQRIESQRPAHDVFMETGEPQEPRCPVFARFEADRDHPLWSEMTMLVPAEGPGPQIRVVGDDE